VTVRAAAVALVAAAACSSAASASAATLSFPVACPRAGATVDFGGTGFAARSKVTVYAGSRVLTTVTASDLGDAVGSFKAPPPTSGSKVAGERSFVLTASDGTNTATATIRVARFGANFSPAQGDPATLRVHFGVFSFPRGTAVFLHYIRPNGTLKQTVALGKTDSVCGSLRSTSKRIFPFKARNGTWRLQFDTTHTYRAAARPRVVLKVPLLPAR
jgi:hypothetical protein